MQTPKREEGRRAEGDKVRAPRCSVPPQTQQSPRGRKRDQGQKS
jgi:hypothetical protein